MAGSASVRLASGFNATVAASRGSIDGQTRDPTAYFVKLGWLDEIFDIGETRFSVDYFRGRNANGCAAPDGDLIEASSWGVIAV